MSEQVDLEANNLCIPEDAFEKFQAVSMYQEEECIMLPRKEPPSPKPPESDKTISRLDVNNVALSSCNELNSSVNNSEKQCIEEQPLSSSCIESSIGLEAGSSDDAQHGNSIYNDENDTDMVVSNSENVNNQTNSASESLEMINVTPRRRGRKPKKYISPIEHTSAGNSKNIQNPDISSTPFSSDPESSDTLIVNTTRRRGRPRKIQNEQTNLEIITKDLSSELGSSENYRMDDTPMKKPGKRGRPKGSGKKAHTHSDVNIDNESQSVNIEKPTDDLIQIHDLDFGNSNNVIETIPKKRKRKSKSFALEKTQKDLSDSTNLDSDMLTDRVSDDDLDDVSLSKLKSVPAQSSMSESVDENITIENKTDSEIKDIISDNMEQPNKASKKRRGRPKKPHHIEKLDQVPEIVSSNDIFDLDDADDMCLSKLKTISIEATNTDSKIEIPDTEIVTSEVPNSDIEMSEMPITETQIDNVEENVSEMNGTSTKRNTKMPVMADFEYNIDSVIENDNTDVNNPNGDDSLLIEDTSKRPVRRKLKKLKYDEGSDEDPFANVELSDDDSPRKGRRGNKYYSDDEYIPGKRGNAAVESTESEISDSEMRIADEFKKQKRRKLRKKSDNQSPRKRGKKDDEPKPTTSNTTSVEQNPEITQTDDVETCLAPAVIKASEGESQPSQPSHQWGTTTEFENFLAKKIHGTSLKIKKVSSNVQAESNKIEIPVLDPEAKKAIEMCTQTCDVPTTSTAVQTTSPYETPIIENIALTPEQSEKACYFLNSIVKTTAELGLLMTQKSEDFIKKKINTSHVTDTTKMDYCVKKSFLLFKLAKHNLLQMEEDLAKQYDQFLETNKLTKCREEQKELLPTPKKADSDSDCEIVNVEPSPQTKKVTVKSQQNKAAFNPKTVFLNKELSIKIAKKPNEGKKLDIKGRHTVWINDTVMVKKVKPTQSFLAQDSRNKKPPDCITTEMVSDFFKDYNRQRALSACAPFVTTDWLNVSKVCVCNYFVVKPLQFNTDDNYTENESIEINGTASDTTVTERSGSLNNVKTTANITAVFSPEPLFALCFRKLKNQMYCNGLNHSKEDTHKIRHELTDGQNVPVTLFRLCVKTIIDSAANDETTDKIEIHPTTSKPESSQNITEITILPLKSLCHRKIVELLANASENNTDEEELYEDTTYCLEQSNDSWAISSQECVQELRKNMNGMKSLFSLCVQLIQKTQHTFEGNSNSISTPKSLKTLAFESVRHLLYTNEFLDAHHCEEEPVIDGLMINCVNSLSEEAFLNLQQYNTDISDSPEYQDNFDNEDNFEADLTENYQDLTEPSWASQVQMQELRSCVNINNTDLDESQQIEPIITHIKLEPLEELADNLLDVTQVKTEPVAGPDEMTIIPDVKPEIDEHVHAGPIVRQNSGSYDVDAFEQFVNSSKLMKSLTEDEGVYSQSSERVRRQHEPDYYEESNIDMLGLLVPHTYEPMNIQTAKGSLMESSSDEGTKNTKTASKKVKRRPGRPKKAEQKINNNKVQATPPPVLTKDKEKEKGTNNEVALLTRKMKEKIRQQEKKDESTDSETENVNMRLRARDKKDNNEQVKDKSKPTQSKSKNTEIQCNNVDSTDQIEDDVGNFTGFTSIETNEMSNYQKYMKFVYDKVIPSKEEEIEANKKQLDSSKTSEKPVINPNEPVELLECEPTLPMLEEKIEESIASKKAKGRGRKPHKVVASEETTATVVANVEKPATVVANVKMPVKEVANDSKDTEAPFVDRHGWQCYPVDSGDSKLYQNACILLEKLPETFVQTYFKYQNIACKDKFDEEIDRLTNLNSLNRSTSLVRKPQNASKRDTKDGASENRNDNDESRTLSAVDSDHYDELQPSDDDVPQVEDEVPLPVQRQTENTLAKNLLMNDNESDDDVGVRVKKEILEESNDITKKSKILSKKKVKGEPQESTETSDLMLTADKMMNKELTLLHAPVVMDEKVKEIPNKGPVTRHTKKSGTKPSPPSNKMKAEEDSSSEEEKQWVSTKEKLLKRMGKKESTSADDAKRAKLVSEFIERREGNLHDSHKRRPVKTRRSGKKFLERQKQLRVLQRELFGETSNDLTVSKRSVATAWKGRRNIRKVLDKKSLARSTVIANMEEFERKRRLNTRQTKLRELLGCEEGVNVLVINDEVCLEYDFEEHRPVVTIHPFFTKVMKAHQYEGVKFMWDACFESLSDMEAGHGGGGCILAHCMGLGKTLQVLALLHTVLTHPRVGMHRVLVCCPLSTVLNWVDEIHKWIGPVTNQIKVFELSKLKKTYERAYQLEDWYNGGGIFIIGYELFRSLSTLDPLLDDVRPTIVNKIRTALLDPGPDIIVCDEGHLLKNDCSVLAVSMSRVVTKRRIVLTGTPMQNNLREYYCMVNFVKPNLLGTYSEYSNRFENPIMNGQHRDSREEDIKLMKARTHILHKVLEGCLQRQEASVLYPYLPKKHEYTVFITLTKCQWDLYKHYMQHYSRQMKQNSILKDFHILQKIWSHPQVLHIFQTKSRENKNKVKMEKLEDDLATEDQEDIKDSVATELWWLQYLEGGNMLDSLETSNKFVVVFRILDECVALGDKVLIFSTSLFCLDVLEYFLKKINKWSLGHEYYRLDGSVPPEVRQKWCREFNAENNVNTKLFLVSTRAGCLGLNMTAANRVIIMDTSWNPAHDIQSIFRVYRFGQKKDCYIYRLVAMGTMEQKIYERSVTKQAVACRVVDEQQIDRHYNSTELTELYRYDEVGSTVAGGVAVGVSDVALLRVARETALHAVHEHDSLLRSSEQGLPEHERAAAWMQFQQEQTHKRTYITYTQHEHDSLLRSSEQGLPEHERAAAWMQFQQEQTHKRTYITYTQHEHDSLLRSSEQGLPEHERAAAWMQFQQEQTHKRTYITYTQHEHDSLLRSSEQGLPEHERAAAWMQFQQEQTHKRTYITYTQHEHDSLLRSSEQGLPEHERAAAWMQFQQEQTHKRTYITYTQHEHDSLLRSSEQGLPEHERAAAWMQFQQEQTHKRTYITYTQHEHDSLLRSSEQGLPEHERAAAWMQFQQEQTHKRTYITYTQHEHDSLLRSSEQGLPEHERAAAWMQFQQEQTHKRTYITYTQHEHDSLLRSSEQGLPEHERAAAWMQFQQEQTHKRTYITYTQHEHDSLLRSSEQGLPEHERAAAWMQFQQEQTHKRTYITYTQHEHDSLLRSSEQGLPEHERAAAWMQFQQEQTHKRTYITYTQHEHDSLLRSSEQGLPEHERAAAWMQFQQEQTHKRTYITYTQHEHDSLLRSSEQGLPEHERAAAWMQFQQEQTHKRTYITYTQHEHDSLLRSSEQGLPEHERAAAWMQFQQEQTHKRTYITYTQHEHDSLLRSSEQGLPEHERAAAWMQFQQEQTHKRTYITYTQHEHDSLLRSSEQGLPEHERAAAWMQFQQEQTHKRTYITYTQHEHDSLLRSSEQGLPEHERAAAWMQFQQEQTHKRTYITYTQHEHDSLLRSSEQGLPEHERAAAWMQFQQEQTHKRTYITYTQHEHDSLLRSSEQGLPEHERAAAWMQFQQEQTHKRTYITYTQHEHDSLLRSSEQGLPEHERAAAWMQFQQEQTHKRTYITYTQHEHDSLLRSSEQGLPEHERAAAWMQFQQEQTHKQMENKLIANIPKISLKRLQGNNYVMADATNANQPIKTEDTSNDFVPPAETKSKRGRKVKKIVLDIPPQASTSKAVPASTHRASKRHKETPSTSTDQTQNTQNLEEETIVEQISNILMKHNFQNKNGNINVSSLMANVRRIVNQGYIYKTDATDDLTISIAKVLLSNRTPLPVATGIMCDSINKSSSADNPQEEPESILSTPTPTYQTGDSRKKRKAAIAAERHIDSLSQDIIINLDDELDTTDKDFVPNGVYIKKRYSKEVTDRVTQPMNSTKTPNYTDSNNIMNDSNKPESAIAKTVFKSKPGPKAFKDKLKNRYKQLTSKKVEALPSFDEPDDRSIALSDDDEPLANKVVPREVPVAPVIPEPEDDEIVPLPLSLLTNKNFINIVAHTYLNGNPMLDQDAATLAAQYSTFKSLKEAEETGRDIISGPIYDIAVKVIGKNLFKRMNTTIACKTVPVEEAHVTVELKEKMREITEGHSKHKKEQGKIVDSYSQNSDTTNPCLNGNVVPVGLIKSAGSMQSDEFASECILPDDDMHIVPHELPSSSQLRTSLTAASSQPPPATRPPVIPKKPIILNHILASKSKNIADNKSNVIKISKGKIIMPCSVTGGNKSLLNIKQPSVIPAKVLSNDDTICLDSDEEETVIPTTTAVTPTASKVTPTVSKLNPTASKVTPTASKVTPTASKVTPTASKVTPKAPKFAAIAPKVTSTVTTVTPTVTTVTPIAPTVVPIATTASGPVPISLTPSLATPGISAQGVPQKPLILRQIAAGSAPKFVLVPANTVIATAPPKLLGVETVTTATGLKLNTVVTSSAPESILSTPTPSPASRNAVKQARCKPGDIIKISDKGEIEVLQANQLNTPSVNKEPQNDVVTAKPAYSEVAKPKSKSANIASKPKQSQSDASKQKINKSQNEVSKPKPASKKAFVEIETSKTRTLSISSSGSDSRPSSPIDSSNPLSILKNVVHIQAADETPSTSSEKIKSKIVRTEKTNDANIYIQHVYANDVKKAAKANAAKIATNQTKPTVTNTKDVAKPSSSTNNVFNDLLLKKTVTLKSTKTGDKKSATPSKSNIIEIKSTSGKTSKTVDLTHYNVSVGSGASILNTKIEAKKRVSTTETSAPKKKKAEPMTLKDFSLDDIDDIIELD